MKTLERFENISWQNWRAESDPTWAEARVLRGCEVFWYSLREISNQLQLWRLQDNHTSCLKGSTHIRKHRHRHTQTHAHTKTHTWSCYLHLTQSELIFHAVLFVSWSAERSAQRGQMTRVQNVRICFKACGLYVLTTDFFYLLGTTEKRYFFLMLVCVFVSINSVGWPMRLFLRLWFWILLFSVWQGSPTSREHTKESLLSLPTVTIELKWLFLCLAIYIKLFKLLTLLEHLNEFFYVHQKGFCFNVTAVLYCLSSHHAVL